jgi:drug/metabolite transporter (DMT)-like permease
MPVKFKLITKILFYSASVIYPLLVFFFFLIQRIQIKQLSFFIIAVALFAFIAGTSTGTSPGASKKNSYNPLHGLPCFFSAQALSAC